MFSKMLSRFSSLFIWLIHHAIGATINVTTIFHIMGIETSIMVLFHLPTLGDQARLRPIIIHRARPSLDRACSLVRRVPRFVLRAVQLGGMMNYRILRRNAPSRGLSATSRGGRSLKEGPSPSVHLAVPHAACAGLGN